MAGWNDIWQTLQQLQQTVAGIGKLLTNGLTITPAPGAATTLTGAVTGTGTGTIATVYENIGNFLRLNNGTIYSGGQITLTATAGGTFTVIPTIGFPNYWINGPSAGGTVTLAVGPGVVDQEIVMNISQGATPAVWHFPNLNFSTSLPAPTITATAGKRDLLTAICNVGVAFDFQAITQGFSP